MKLYIANCTKQNWQVQYRLDFNAQGAPINPGANRQPAKQQDIPAGRQVQIGGDMHISQVDQIIDQLTPYGLVALKEVPGLKTTFKKYDPMSIHPTPLVFNVDAVVPPAIIRQVHDMNNGILVDQGRIRRERAAIGVNQAVQARVAGEFANAGVDAMPTEDVSVAIEQLDQSEAGEKRIEEGYRVAPEGRAPTGGSSKKPSRKKQS